MKIFLLLLTITITLLADDLVLSGSVISDNKKSLTSRFMGFVTDVEVAVGDKVKKGELLYSIDSRDLDIKISQVKLGISQAELNLQMVQSQYLNAKLNLNRNQRLLQKDMVSQFDVENIALKTQNLHDMVEIAKKQLEQAKNRVAQIKSQYKYLNVKAPNSGVVVAKNIKVGEMAMPGVPAIILSDLSHLKILTEISETNLHLIKYGTKVVVKIPSMHLKTIGTVSAIIPNSNPMTHSFKIKVSFKKQMLPIYPGMYATVNIGAGQDANK